MEQIFFNSEEKIESAMTERKERVVSLLIPEVYYDRLSKEEQKRLCRKLPYLLRRYTKFMASHSRLNCKAVTTLYQKDRGKMKKINLRVSTGFWSVLGALSHAHGVSRCYLFNFLLSLEQAGVGDSIVEILNAGVPTFHQVYRYIWQLDIDQNKAARFLEFTPNPIQPFFDMSFPWAKHNLEKNNRTQTES
ncbi:DUF1564 domain-containing protein [Leptospira sp. WS92.C1]